MWFGKNSSGQETSLIWTVVDFVLVEAVQGMLNESRAPYLRKVSKSKQLIVNEFQLII
jgi:hypothetical protein